jgi:hypothetical protein
VKQADASVAWEAGFEWSGVIRNLDVGDPELVFFKALDREAV